MHPTRPTTARDGPHRPSVTIMRRSWWVTVLALSLLLAGCTGSSGSSSSSGSGAGSGAAASAADGAVDGQDGAAAGPAAPAQDPGGRQVVTTAAVAVQVEDPRAAADAITADVEGRGGRVDERSERAAGRDGDRDSEAASATLVVRVPSDQVSATVAALRDLGEVGSVKIASDDVTGTAQDLDARIDALRTSTARLEALIAGASTTADLITAEQALTNRQAALEQLQAERARLAEQVSLSTLRVSLSTGAAPAAGRGGFLGGLSAGWHGLRSAAGAGAVALGVLLPWIVVAGAVAAAVVAVRRRLRRRRVASPS